MTFAAPERPSDLDIQDVLRRRAAEMHSQVDTWLELTLRELGVEPTQEEVVHTLGISFEPSVQLLSLPDEQATERVGFYSTRPGATVEVVPTSDATVVRFEYHLPDGQTQLCELDQVLFDRFFRPQQLLDKALLTQRLSPETQVRYGLHPIYSCIALRYNADGSVTRGRYGESGEFIAEQA